MKLIKTLLAIGMSVSLLIASCPTSNALSSISSIKVQINMKQQV